jgi:hypothetical protein
MTTELMIEEIKAWAQDNTIILTDEQIISLADSVDWAQEQAMDLYAHRSSPREESPEQKEIKRLKQIIATIELHFYKRTGRTISSGERNVTEDFMEPSGPDRSASASETYYY